MSAESSPVSAARCLTLPSAFSTPYESPLQSEGEEEIQVVCRQRIHGTSLGVDAGCVISRKLQERTTLIHPHKISFSSSIHFTDLFPHDSSLKDTEKALEQIEFMIKILKRAGVAFLRKNLFKFDGQVGENACQIRAAMLVDMCAKGKVEELNKQIAYTLLRLVKIKQKLEKVKAEHIVLKKGETFFKFCERIGLNFEIDSEVALLSQLFLLTLAKGKKDGDAKDKVTGNINVKEMLSREKVPFSRCYSQELVDYYQKTVSQKSVAFVRSKYLELLDDDVELREEEAIFETEEVDFKDRSCIPCLFGSEVLLKSAKKDFRHLLIVVYYMDDMSEIIGTTDFSKTYRGVESFLVNLEYDTSFIPVTSLDIDESVIVAEGVCLTRDVEKSRVEVASEFKQQGLISILLSNFADHPQYPSAIGQSEKIRAFSEEIATKSSHAREIGCGLENPFLWVIRHAYAGTLEQHWKPCHIRDHHKGD